jgi:hypothetical protein
MTNPPYIIAVTGLGPALGTGKTTTLTILAYMLYREGRTIYSNFGLKIPHKNFYDLLKTPQTLLNSNLRFAGIVVDDSNLIIESRRSSQSWSLFMSYFAQQCRKRDIRLVYSGPILAWTDVRFWDIASMHIRCWHDSDTNTLYWHIVDWRDAEPKQFKIAFTVPQEIYDLFDTKEILLPAFMETGMKQVCPECGSGDLRYSRRDDMQYCGRCGWYRVGVRHGKKKREVVKHAD